MTLSDLFLMTLNDLYFAERRICESLPKMADAAQDPGLRRAFLGHRDETEGQIDRLAQVFEALGKRPRGLEGQTIVGLIEECEKLIEEAPPGAVRDAGLIACAQAIEHHEIARYGVLVAWAKAASNRNIGGLLQDTLDQEIQAGALLTGLSARLNADAADAA